MTASRVVAILTELEHRAIAAWLDGGWGVDALLERETRGRAHATGYALDAAHQRDVDALCARFGIPRPSYRRAE